MKKILIVIMIFGHLMACSNQKEKIDKSKLTGYDYRLFQDTPAWPLAKAVEEGDTSEIRIKIVENKINPNYQESQYGHTLLMMAIFNNAYLSTKTLLDLGADPNIRDKHRGANSIIAAANRDPKYLKLLLMYKGNPNIAENKSVAHDDSPMQTALTSAISYDYNYSLEKVKLLIEAGANVNYPNDNNTDLPLGVAIKRNNMDVTLYLLDKGADYKMIMYKMFNGHHVYILEALRNCVFEPESQVYMKKLEVIAFLKDKGLDYAKEPIPGYILDNIKKKYPNSWQEYIKKY